MVPILTETPMPDTHWPYWTKRLACYWMLNADVLRVPVIHVGTPGGPVPAWRLTPDVFAWFWVAVMNLCDRPATTREAATAAAAAIAEMDGWLGRHDLGAKAVAAVRRARAGKVPSLPPPPPYHDLGADPVPVDASFDARHRPWTVRSWSGWLRA